MWNTVSEAYAASGVGQTTTVRPSDGKEDTLRRFQSEIKVARGLAREQKIRLVLDHKESQTGFDFTDLITFERIA
ncbi:hypothetical protein PAQ31011_05128 [Pandoraea aquatica]|uniref:Uncharacterized protein n=1 Tax=Pandoraea aquatica TaxID=2508290 RepID=A0A5E4Z6C4_9BURK|nr:hypothetical protein [Pandoraea aquatica]VVE56666.1 hypothetical protein PAQ31011_05128 [Pandoraea aquatica]